MNVAFIADSGNADGTVGGAELTMAEFAKAAPKNVTVHDGKDQLPPLNALVDADAVVIGNCVFTDPGLIKVFEGKRVLRYHNDLAKREHPRLRNWLEKHATHVFTSPFHQERYGLEGDWPNIPPALRLRRYRKGLSGDAEGAVAIAPWQNLGKGQQALREWSDRNGPLDVFGPGGLYPEGPNIRFHGPLPPSKVAAVLRKYKTFVHLPSEPEPFGRTVVEAWATGCRLIVNRNIGALYYLQEAPERLESAAEDFWKLVLG